MSGIVSLWPQPRAALASGPNDITCARCNLRETCLSGGVLQNRRLATALLDRLTADGFTVHLNEQVPCNDGGLSYGQAAIAAATLTGATSTATGRPAPTTRTKG